MRGEFSEIDGTSLYYYASGTRESGRTIVLLHGILTSAHLWARLSVSCLGSTGSW
ncbi:MAG: alpha/beta fold hydrolase [Gemmatimonadota bacterium]